MSSIIYRDTYKALQHLKRSCRSHSDEVAVNTITEFVKAAERAQDQKMKPYLKLYTHLFMRFSQHYQELPDSNEGVAQKEVHRIMDRDLDQMFYEISQDFNLMLLERATAKGGSPMHDPYTPKEVGENLKAQALKAFLKYQKK